MEIKGLFVSKKSERTSPVAAVLNLFIVCLLLAALFGISPEATNVTFDFSFAMDYRVRLLGGFLTTVKSSVVSLLLSPLIGTASAAGQESGIPFIKYLCGIHAKLIHGTPLTMQIYLSFYIIGAVWGVQNQFVAGVLILSIFEGAYIVEIIRGSLFFIEDSQLEAAKAVGLTGSQTVRHVLPPRLIAKTLSALAGQFVSIVKDSSLLSMIAVIELTQTTREISAMNFKLLECYLALGPLHLCLTLPVSFISSKLERRFQYEN